MTGWTAIVPMKSKGQRKTRLEGHVTESGRDQLSEQLFSHVVRTLQDCPQIIRIVVLSGAPPAQLGVDWVVDAGGGLNAELERVRADIGDAAVLIIHADLPLLEAADIGILLALAEKTGIALAPDRIGSGTNAIALKGDRQFELKFGADSFRLHREQATNAGIVSGRPGLALDVDTAADLEEATRRGFTIG
jgi:2-phospho-L-lactate/phosphoenolpyruvate guanylyltransferase